MQPVRRVVSPAATRCHRHQPDPGAPAMPDGRYTLVLRCPGETQAVELEKRGVQAAIALGGHWVGVEANGYFHWRGKRLAEDQILEVEISGTVRGAGNRWEVELLEQALSGAASKRWRGVLVVPTDGVADHLQLTVALCGTAEYSFLDGSTRTPLTAELGLVRQVDGQRFVTVPPTLTANRGRLTLPIDATGAFAYRDPDPQGFRLHGRVGGQAVELVIESAGSIGWTRKSLSGRW